MKKALLFAAVATVALAGSAQAQICAGFPSSDRGFYFGGRVDFPEGGDAWGVEANYNASGPLGVYGGLNVLSAEGSDEDTNQFVVGVALETPSLGAMIGPSVSACPVVEARIIDEDGGSIMQFPIGLGIGANLGSPVGPAINGYVQPALVITRVSIDGFDDETETDFGIKGGVNVGFGLFSVGGEIRHVFIDEADPEFGIRFGVRI